MIAATNPWLLPITTSLCIAMVYGLIYFMLWCHHQACQELKQRQERARAKGDQAAPIVATGPDVRSDLRRFKVKAFNVNGENFGQGSYSIWTSVGDGYWIEVQRFIDLHKCWNPVLLPYEQAKAQAYEWKQYPNEYEKFVRDNQAAAEAYATQLANDKKRWFPVSEEEV